MTLDTLEKTEHKKITDITMSTHKDKDFGPLEKLFTITEVEIAKQETGLYQKIESYTKTKESYERIENQAPDIQEQIQALEKEIQSLHSQIKESTVRQIQVLFTDNAFYWENQFDHIIGVETTSIGEEIASYIEAIKNNLTENLIAKPKQADYQSIYNTIKSQPILQPILENKRIQDWAHLDETIYTEPSEDIIRDTQPVLSRVEEHKIMRETAYALLRHNISEQKRIFSLITMHTKLLQDNTKLIDDTNIQTWQELHKEYQSTTETLQILKEKAVKYRVDMNDLQETIKIVSTKIASLETSNERLADAKYNFEKKKNAKNQKNILKVVPGGSIQGHMIIDELGRNMYAYEDQLAAIQEGIAQQEEILQVLEEKLIAIFPPAQEMFGLIQQEEEQLISDKQVLETYDDTTQNLHHTLIEKKQAKNTLVFLYDEALFLHDIKTLHISAKTLSVCKKILTHPSLSQEEKDMYISLQKYIHTIIQQQSNRHPDQELIDTTLSNVSALKDSLHQSHTQRFIGHQTKYPDIAGHFAAIDEYTKQIHIQEQLIGQERKHARLNKNQSNDTIDSYKETIGLYKKNIKFHERSVAMYTQQPQEDYERSAKKLAEQTTAVTQRTVTIQSLQRRITDLLANPNNLIIVRDPKKIQEKIDNHKSKLLSLQNAIDVAEKNTSHAIDIWYQEILALSTIFARIQEHDTTLQEMETILTDYLPKDRVKWDDTDRDIRGKRDAIHDSRISLYALVQQIDSIVKDSVQTNKELRRNNLLRTLQQDIKTFFLQSDINL